MDTIPLCCMTLASLAHVSVRLCELLKLEAKQKFHHHKQFCSVPRNSSPGRRDNSHCIHPLHPIYIHVQLDKVRDMWSSLSFVL